MKTRQEFLEHFFTRLRQAGFRVEPLPDGDLAAEVYAGNPLLCVVTRDGEIIYETYDRDNARAMTQAAEETRRAQDCHSEPPFPNIIKCSRAPPWFCSAAGRSCSAMNL